jgi:hypothetical protein
MVVDLIYLYFVYYSSWTNGTRREKKVKVKGHKIRLKYYLVDD